MKTKLIDTNIIIRFFVEDRGNLQYKKIFDLFERLETKDESVFIDNLVIIEAFYVLLKVYHIPIITVVESLEGIVAFAGIEMENKTLISSTFNRLKQKKIDFADAYLIELSLLKNSPIFTNDNDIICSPAETIKLIN